jgi:hypothetical protein
MEEKRSIALPAIVAVVLLLPSVYIGSYCSLIGHATSYVQSADGKTVRIGRAPAYAIGGWPSYGSDAHDWLKATFSLAHIADCRLRPDHWALGEPRELPPDWSGDTMDFFDLTWDQNGKLVTRDELIDTVSASAELAGDLRDAEAPEK